MNKLQLNLFACSFLLSAQAMANAPLPAPSHYLISHSANAPLIDGKLNDKSWDAANFTTAFVQHDNGAAAPIQTRAKLLYDDHYLYVGFETEDADIYTQFNNSQDPLFIRDDLIELFTDPLSTGKNYIELGASAKGVLYGLQIPGVYDGKVEPSSFDVRSIIAATAITGTLNNPADIDKGWSIELRIPLATIIQAYPASKPTLTPGTKWRLGLFRIDYDHQTPARKALGFYAWQHHGTFGFHQPERFAVIEFGKPTAQVSHNTLGTSTKLK